VLGIFRLNSGCNEDLLSNECPWRLNVREYYAKVQEITSKAFILQQALIDYSNVCPSYGKANPWYNQECKGSDNCNYHYGLALSAADRDIKLKQAPRGAYYELAEKFLTTDITSVCYKMIANQGSSFAEGGLFNYADKPFRPRLQRFDKGDTGCYLIAQNANNIGNVVYGAVRNFCFLKREEDSCCQNCRKMFELEQLWGFRL